MKMAAAFIFNSSILTVCTLCLSGCSDDGTRTISSSVIGSVACDKSADTWYRALAYKQNFGSYPSDDGESAATMLMPGDRVQLLDTHNVDDQPGLVSVTGVVFKVKVLSGTNPGTTCWLYSGSDENGSLFD